MRKIKTTSVPLDDSNVHSWRLYRKWFTKGFEDMSGREYFITSEGDLWHIIGEVWDYFRTIRPCYNKGWERKWELFQEAPYCFLIWARLLSNIHEHRLFYIITCKPSTRQIIIYSATLVEGKPDHYKIYKWRGEDRTRLSDVRRYRQSKLNYVGEVVIKSSIIPWTQVELVARGKKFVSYKRKENGSETS